MKTWSQSCHSFHAVKALASPKLSKRATPKAPRSMYIDAPKGSRRNGAKLSGTYIRHPKGRSRCFVFDNKFEVAKFSHRQNQSVQKTPFVCMCVKPALPPLAGLPAQG